MLLENYIITPYKKEHSLYCSCFMEHFNETKSKSFCKKDILIFSKKDILIFKRFIYNFRNYR